MTTPASEPSSTESGEETKPRRRKPGTPASRKPGSGALNLKGKRGGEVLSALHEANAKEKRKVTGRYDWDYARDLFISADPPITLKKLGEDLQIPYAYLRQRSSTERWTYLRSEEQKRLYKKKREELARSRLEQAMRFDENSQRTANLGQTLVMARLSEIAELHQALSPQFQRVIANIKAGLPLNKGDLNSAIRFTELKELALAAKLFQDMGRLSFGIEEATKTIEESAGDNSVEHVISVSAELGKADPRRLAAMLEAFERTGLVSMNLLEDKEDNEGEDDIADPSLAERALEGEVVSDPLRDATNGASRSEAMKELTHGYQQQTEAT